VNPDERNPDMEKRCENCGIRFEAAPQARFHSDACRKAFSRKTVEEDDPGIPLDYLMDLNEAEEQRLRDELGYAESEKRGEAERQEAADRILAKQRQNIVNLPADIELVWRSDPETARFLIDGWGLEEFRGSALHQAALGERRRAQEKQVYRDAFVKATQKGGASSASSSSS
jgi:hypothetical protein